MSTVIYAVSTARVSVNVKTEALTLHADLRFRSPTIYALTFIHYHFYAIAQCFCCICAKQRDKHKNISENTHKKRHNHKKELSRGTKERRDEKQTMTK